MKSIDQKLIACNYRKMRKTYLDQEYASLLERIEREQQTLERLKKALEKEQNDVERLAHASINRLFTTLSGRSDLRLEKEKADQFRAALDYKLKQQDLEFLFYQKNLLEQEIKPYESWHQDYLALLEIKRKMLDQGTLAKIREMETTLNLWQTKQAALKEAVAYGKKLRSSYTYLLDHLNELVEDTTDARSLWYPAISQEEVEEVSIELNHLGEQWQRFETLLDQIDVALPEHFDKALLVKIQDYAQHKEPGSHIDTSFEHLNATYSSVRELLCQLEKKEKEIEYCIHDLQFDIQQKIEESEV